MPTPRPTVYPSVQSGGGVYAGVPAPLLPAWVPAPGDTANINLNSLAALNTCPADNCWYSQSSKQMAGWRNWNGAVYAPGFSTHGAMLFWGGGHGGGEDISLWCFDFTTRLWSRIGPSNPTTSAYTESLDATFYDYLHEGSYIVPALHTYGYPVYVPPNAPGVGAKGAWLLTHLVGGPNSGSAPHAVDLDSGQWIRFSSNKPAAGPAPYAGAFVDTTRNKVYWEGIDTAHFNSLDLSASHPRTVAREAIPNGGSYSFGFYYARAVYVPEADQVIHIGSWYNQQQLRAEIFDMGSGSPAPIGGTTFGTTYNLPLLPNGTTPNGSGVDWCEHTQSFYLYPGWGTTTVYKITPSSLDFSTATWTITTETFNNPAWDTVTGAGAQGAQPFSRWRYIPTLRCFAWCDGPNVDGGRMQLWRPAGT